MPVPALVAAALSSQLSGLIGEIATPARRLAGYAANAAMPVDMPSPQALFTAYSHGLLDTTTTKLALRAQGIDWIPSILSPEVGLASYVWSQISQLNYSYPGEDLLSRMYLAGQLTREEWQRHMVRSGAHTEAWEEVLPGLMGTPTTGELLTAFQRGAIPRGTMEDGLRRRGISEEAWFVVYDNLRLWYPPPSDLVQFAVRDVFDPRSVELQGLYQEYPDQLTPWFSAQGMVYNIPGAPSGPGFPESIHWGHVHWAAHWRHLSPEQLYRFRHKFRTGRMDRYVIGGVELEPWSDDKTLTGLKVADYPPGVRRHLVADTYIPLRLVDIRRAHQLGVRDRGWAREQLLDRGHHPRDVEDILDFWDELKSRDRTKEARKVAEAALRGQVRVVLDSYQAGIVSAEEAQTQLGLAGLDRYTIGLLLGHVDLRQGIAVVKAAVSDLRRRYLGGEIDGRDLPAALQRAGLHPDRAESMAALWRRQLTQRRRQLSTTQILRMVGRQLLSPEDARERLLNLGWQEPDALLWLAEARQDLLRRQGQLLSADERARRRAASEAQRLIQQGRKQQEQLQGRLRRLTPVALLQRSVARGTISPDFFRRRMDAMGYDGPSTELYLADALRARRAGEPRNGRQETGGAPPAP